MEISSYEDRKTLERLEEELWREETRFDPQRMNELIADDFFEVVSPGAEQIERDYTEKATEYQNLEIPEYWIVDPIAQKITVLVLKDGSYTKTAFTGDEEISSVTFSQLQVTAEEILSP